MAIPRLHLIAPAGSCREFLAESGLETAEALIAFVQEAYKIIKSSVAIKAEAEKRITEGETFPPKAAA